MESATRPDRPKGRRETPPVYHMTDGPPRREIQMDFGCSAGPVSLSTLSRVATKNRSCNDRQSSKIPQPCARMTDRGSIIKMLKTILAWISATQSREVQDPLRVFPSRLDATVHVQRGSLAPPLAAPLENDSIVPRLAYRRDDPRMISETPKPHAERTWGGVTSISPIMQPSAYQSSVRGGTLERKGCD